MPPTVSGEERLEEATQGRAALCCTDGGGELPSCHEDGDSMAGSASWCDNTLAYPKSAVRSSATVVLTRHGVDTTSPSLCSCPLVRMVWQPMLGAGHESRAMGLLRDGARTSSPAEARERRGHAERAGNRSRYGLLREVRGH